MFGKPEVLIELRVNCRGTPRISLANLHLGIVVPVDARVALVDDAVAYMMARCRILGSSGEFFHLFWSWIRKLSCPLLVF